MADDVCDRCSVAEYEVALAELVTREGDVLVLCPSCSHEELRRWDREEWEEENP